VVAVSMQFQDTYEKADFTMLEHHYDDLQILLTPETKLTATLQIEVDSWERALEVCQEMAGRTNETPVIGCKAGTLICVSANANVIEIEKPSENGARIFAPSGYAVQLHFESL